ncbi:hypothetical protein, partial [Streptomyces sp. SID3212]|uniref:hypothetical protein n=1 Tax=Streptomyces sp. SID3212 TaxID=2690259 RepID=UPI001F32B791
LVHGRDGDRHRPAIHQAKAELRAHRSARPVDPSTRAARDRHTASSRMREPEHLFSDGQAAALEELRARPPP